MRFHAEHRLAGTVPAVLALLADSNFYVDLALPDLSQPEVLEHHTEEHTTTVRLRYEFTGSLDPIAKRLLGANKLAWIQEVRVDRTTPGGTLSFGAEKDPKRLHGSADFTLTADGDGTLRWIDGELVVAVPGIGRMAERRIVPGLLRRLDIEARKLDQLVEGSEDPGTSPTNDEG
jgi:hypothetical protein